MVPLMTLLAQWLTRGSYEQGLLGPQLSLALLDGTIHGSMVGLCSRDMNVSGVCRLQP